MIVRRFLTWARMAPPGARAQAADALARAYLYSDMAPADRIEAEAALTHLLDDSSPLVRRALAEALARADGAPHHIIAGLVAEGGEAATLVLARSPLLDDAELVDAAAVNGEPAQIAIAGRPDLSAEVSAAIAEIGTAPACAALADNHSADIAAFSLARIVERHGSQADLREALLRRPNLPIAVREALVVAVSQALAGLVRERNWLGEERSARITQEAQERATLHFAEESNDPDLICERLRADGRLTVSLLLRAVTGGQMPVVAAALAALTGTPARRIAAALSQGRGHALTALIRRAGLPDWMGPAIATAVAARSDISAAIGTDGPEAALVTRRVIGRMVAMATGRTDEASRRLVAQLRRLEAEAARDEARLLTQALIEVDTFDAGPPPVPATIEAQASILSQAA